MTTKAQTRHRYLAYSDARLQRFCENYTEKQARLIRLLPLLLHTNKNLMPGHISKRIPYGISGYTPPERSLLDAQKISSTFRYDPENQPEQAAIEAVFLQQCILSGEEIFWVIHNDKLDRGQLDLLNGKLTAIMKWLGSFGIQLQFILSTASSISYQYYSFKHYKFHIDKCFFLDNFYAESIYLGGKIPAWWLYVTEADKASEDDLLLCGELVTPRPGDYMSAAIWHLYNIFQQPETSWVNLAIIEQFVTSRMHQFFAVELREIVHNADEMSELDVYQGYSIYLKDTIDIKQENLDYNIISNKNRTLHGSSGTRRQHAHKTVFDYLSSAKVPASLDSHAGVDFRRYSQAVESLFKRSEQLFRRIKTCLNLTSTSCVSLCHELNSITNGLLSRLVDADKKITFINPSPVFSMERIHFRNQLDKDGESWSMLADPRDEQSVIKTSDKLIHLVCWGFLNRLIDGASQVSIQCADFSIRQTDIQNIIRALQHSVHFSDFTDIEIDQFIDEPRPVRSVLFIGHNSEYFREQTIDHLIIYNTGEIFIHSYKGLHVFYNWFQSAPQQSVNACLYGSWAKDYRNLNRKILSRIEDISVY